ncbi:MAG TPA: hypothetical protein VF246_01040 [Acidimicrobiia bacterium]
MTAPQASDGRRTRPSPGSAVVFLLVGVAVMAVALYLFGCRDPIGLRLGPCPEVASPSMLYDIERSLFGASAIVTAIGLWMLSMVSGEMTARVGALIFLVGAFLIFTVEAASAAGWRILQARSLTAGYVILACLGQAGVGWGLIRWMRAVGWIVVVFNLGLLVGLLVLTPNDMYFPVAHVVMPAVIAVALLVTGRSADDSSSRAATE